jgi:NADPH-dependent 2,4-dienoyl-CoA reductase/sulfur reductase-like enzyme
MHFRRAPFLDIHKKLRPAAAGAPVMAIGRIATPAEAEAALAEGAGDLVGLTRALIADADWPVKARAGRVEDIRPSTYDNFAWGEIHAGKPLAEVHNPQLGRRGESGWRPARAAKRRRVVVVGAGPAGMQAARIAAESGHDVMLLSASSSLGGKLRWEAALPGRGEYENLIAWMERKARSAGVKVELGRRVAAADVLALEPDCVIVATGSHPRRPEAFEGDGLSVRDWPTGSGGATAVLFDMDHSAATYAAADALARCHRRLVLVTPRTQLARNVNYCSAIGVYRRLYEANAEIVLAAEPVRLRNRTLTCRNVFTGRTREFEDVELFLWSTPRVVDDAIAAPRREAGVDVRLAGDCLAPRNLFCAIHEGEALALAL